MENNTKRAKIVWGENNIAKVVDDPNGNFVMGIDPWDEIPDNAMSMEMHPDRQITFTKFTFIQLKLRLLKRRIELYLKGLFK